MKRPSFQFYPADWRKDAALQSCSLEARGLWIECMCIAHECEPYGHLVINGRPMTAPQIARLVGVSAKECDALLAELVGAGVAEMADGVLFSRRMVRDEALRNRRAEGGKEHGHKGAEHGKKGAGHGVFGGRPKLDKGAEKPPLNPPLGDDGNPPNNAPPSSSSSSSSSELINPDGLLVASKPATPVCPHQEIIAAYHELLPSLTRVRDWTPERQTFLRKRWTEDPERQTVQWWRDFFVYVSESDFLMGRRCGPNGTFECDLEWLVRPKNFVKVIEGRYENRGQRSAA